MSPRFCKPVTARQRPTVRFVEAFSPKLNRRVRLLGRHAFELWLLLESDPEVFAFCERPIHINDDQDVVDFWVRRDECERFLIIGDRKAGNTHLSNYPDIELRCVTLAELAANHVWLRNWERILPYINCCRGIPSPALQESILRFIAEPTQLSRVERHFSTGDPSVVRAALFGLLHAGRIQSSDLRVQPLNSLTSFEPRRRQPS